LVKNLRRQAGLVVGELLGVAEGALQPGHHARLAAQIPGRAAVTRDGPAADPHRVPRGEAAHSAPGVAPMRARAHHGTVSLAILRPALACLARTSAMRASTSSRVTSSCSTMRLRMARIHFS